jgi:hypothetical protein
MPRPNEEPDAEKNENQRPPLGKKSLQLSDGQDAEIDQQKNNADRDQHDGAERRAWSHPFLPCDKLSLQHAGGAPEFLVTT